MPRRNVLKIDIANSFYHIYARGNNRGLIFVDDEDYAVFLNLLKRYLSKQPQVDKQGVPYSNLYGSFELLAYCLMPNHFHLLGYQRDEGAMSKLMRGIMSSYSKYFNTRHGRSGSMFESRYMASRISADNYLHHISRYIHLNPKDWQTYKYSSIPFYKGEQSAEWIRPRRVLELFANIDEYLEFVADYEENKLLIDELKHELANPTTT